MSAIAPRVRASDPAAIWRAITASFTSIAPALNIFSRSCVRGGGARRPAARPHRPGARGASSPARPAVRQRAARRLPAGRRYRERVARRATSSATDVSKPTASPEKSGLSALTHDHSTRPGSAPAPADPGRADKDRDHRRRQPRQRPGGAPLGAGHEIIFGGGDTALEVANRLRLEVGTNSEAAAFGR
jgi:hypothetical protein